MLLAVCAGGFPRGADRESCTPAATMTVREKAEAPEGEEALRDIPESITIVPEKLFDDRNRYTLTDCCAIRRPASRPNWPKAARKTCGCAARPAASCIRSASCCAAASGQK